MSTQTKPSTFRLIPLRCLCISSLNVRKTGVNAGIEQLAELIDAEGVLQNLDVYEAQESEGKKGVTHAVIGGGRRLRALQLLLKQKRIKSDHPVPCLVVSYERAVQVSLSENSGRESMHPADEFEAFRALIDAGQSIEDVAARFGVKPVVVQRRLKLANVSPTFIAMYREGKGNITLEHLMAFAVTEDHARQEAAWESLKSYERSPSGLRQVLLEQEVSSKDPIARFVGMKAYQKAGGVLRRDLFAQEEEGALLDAELVRRLASEKLDKQAAQLKAEGFAWVEVHLEWDYSMRSNYGRVGRIVRERTEAERARLEELQARKAEIVKQEAEAEDDEAQLESLSDLENRLDLEIDAIEEACLLPDPVQQSCAGAVVSLDHQGKLLIERDLLKPEDAQRFAKEHKARQRVAQSQGPRTHSAALVRRLTAQRTLALQATLTQRPDVALIALTHRLVLETFALCRYSAESALRIDVDDVGLSPHAKELEGSKAHEALEAQRLAWEAKLPQAGSMLPWLMDQPQSEVLALLAFCVAQSVAGVQSTETPSATDELARVAGLDLREWWSVTAEGYLGSIPKAQVLEAVKEAVSAEAAAPLSKLKKAAMVKAAEERLVGTGWLPAFLRNVA